MILEYNVVQHQRRKFYLAPLFKFCSTDSIYDHCRLKMPCTPLNRAKCTRSSHSPPSYCLRASLIKSPHAPRNITRTRPPQPIHCFSPAAGASKNNKTLSQQPPVPATTLLLDTTLCELPMSLFLSVRFQDQVGDASVGPNNLTSVRCLACA